jgi:PPOX class probable F420-dependent enzyme
MGQLTMSRAEREEFLAGTHVGVLAVARGPGEPPLVSPVWYEYEPGGDVVVLTGDDAEKTRLAREHGEASLCAQTEELPYKYVTVSGPTAVTEGVDREQRRRIAHKYLGPEFGDVYLQATEGADTITLRIRPERWRTTDYSKMEM